MGDLKFALSIMKRDKGNSGLYIASIILSTAILFDMFTMNFNEDFINGNEMVYFSISGMTGIIIFVAAMFMFLANLYLISSKCKEFGVLILSGRSIVDVAFYVIWQNIILTTVGTIIGFVLGIILLPAINMAMYNTIGLAPKLFEIGPGTFIAVIILIILQYVMAVVVNFGYVRQREISELVVERDKMYNPDNRMIKVNPIIYLILFILIIFYPLFCGDDIKYKFDLSSNMLTLILLAIVAQGLISLYIPRAIMGMKKRWFSFDKIKVIALSNLHYAMRKSSWLVIALLISNECIIFTLGMGSSEVIVSKAGVINLFGVIILLAIMITFKVLIEAMNRKSNFKQLLLLGYNKLQIKKIIRTEVISFFFIIFIVSFAQVFISFILGTMAGFIKITDTYLVMGTSIITYILACLITYFYYNKIVMNYIKEF